MTYGIPRHPVKLYKSAAMALFLAYAAYWKASLDLIKPSDRPLAPQTHIKLGCPHDCGLCPDQEQHTCLALIEIDDHCNLTCPACFANSSPTRDGTRSLAEVEAMLDALFASEGAPDLVQISGGEPTLHPQILEILLRAKLKPATMTSPGSDPGPKAAPPPNPVPPKSDHW